MYVGTYRTIVSYQCKNNSCNAKTGAMRFVDILGAIDVGITCPSVHRPSFILNASVKRVVAFQQSTGVVESNYTYVKL